MIKVYNVKDCLEDLEEIMEWSYEEWGKYFRSSKDEKIAKMKEIIKKGEEFPQIYAIKDDGKLVGSFTIKDKDLEGSDLSPWIACVLVKKELRGKGYGRVVLENIKKIIDEKYPKIYLFTSLDGFYEKIGFEYIKDVMHNGEVEKLYEYRG